MSSFGLFLTTSRPIPENTPGVYATLGTQETRTAQGFFIQFNSGTHLLNASFSVYYLLVIGYKWTEEWLR
jgi:hypothetical protein